MIAPPAAVQRTAAAPVTAVGQRADAARFREVITPRVMGPRLGAVLGGPPTCHVVDAKYEPGIRAIAVYEHGGRFVRADLLPRDLQSDGAPAAIAEPGVALHPFPHDPELPSLPTLLDPDGLRRIGRTAGRTRPRVTVLRYRPGKRATILVRHGADVAWIGKAYHDRAKATAVATESEQLARALNPLALLQLAPTLGLDSDLCLVRQAVVAGLPVDALLGDARRPVSARAGDAMAMAAAALAELHGLPPVSRRPRSVDRELRRFGERSERLATVDPALGAATGRLARRLESIQHHLPAPRLGLVHGDCKPSQFLLGWNGVWLLDLDHLGMSDQATDAGSFVATLRQQAVRDALAGRRTGRAADLAVLERHFLDAYLERAADRYARPRIAWQVAVALERKALRAFARAPHGPLAAALVAEANRVLDSLEEGA